MKVEIEGITFEFQEYLLIKNGILALDGKYPESRIMEKLRGKRKVPNVKFLDKNVGANVELGEGFVLIEVA